MSNKLILILLSILLACPVFAQKMRYRPRYRRPTTTQQQQPKTTTSVTSEKTAEKKTSDKKTVPTAPPRTTSSSSPSRQDRFDPKKTMLTQQIVDSIMDGMVRKGLLERKLPSKMPVSRKRFDEEDDENEKKDEKTKLITQFELYTILNRFRSLTKHFELTEVTNIRPVWFERYLAELSKFDPIVYQLNRAVQERSNERYIRAVQLFKDQQEVCLKMLKEKKPGLTQEERESLVKKNTQLRIENRRKQRQAELQRKQAEQKRRQEEQLKQQNQQQQKTAAPAAGK